MAKSSGERSPGWLEQLERKRALREEADGTTEQSAEEDERELTLPITRSGQPIELNDPAGPRGGTPAPDSTPARALRRSEAFDADDPAMEALREEAIQAARLDAASGVPSADAGEPSESEKVLRDRCRAFFSRRVAERREDAHDRLAGQEQEVVTRLGQASLGIDRFERLTNELVRLKARLAIRRDEVTSEISETGTGRQRGLPTKVYLLAIGFLGVVEFFANAPVFSALLPRDPLTERQIRLVAETSQGWFAGAERVFAHLILRPDAALLAAGIVTFLCVLAHFFGHSLRELVMQGDRGQRQDTHSTRSPIENIVPMALSGLGLLLVLGVLYEARVTLGEVGEEQYGQDMAVVEELRREASWRRVDGELLEANELDNRGDDMQAAATELREYAGSMSRLSFPILLLNMTLVLCAISAAYFHRRDSRREQFNESPFENERRSYIDAAEEEARLVADHLAELTRGIRKLAGLTGGRASDGSRALAHHLESIIAVYRSENGRARGIDPHTLPAFSRPVELDLDIESEERFETLRPAVEYEEERQKLHARFGEVRARFNERAIA